MNDKELNKKFCEVVGIAPRKTYFCPKCSATLMQTTDKNAYFCNEYDCFYLIDGVENDWREQLEALDKDEILPDFINNANNFVRLMEVRVDNSLYHSLGDLVFAYDKFVTREFFIKCLIDLLTSRIGKEPKVFGRYRQAIKSEQWEY